MVINLRECTTLPPEARVSVFVDNRPVKLVWYVDTESGIVKTYDVMGDNRVHSVRDEGALHYAVSSHDKIEILFGGFLSKTLSGTVSLRRDSVKEDSSLKKAGS